LWAVIALARLGLGDEAMELFHMINPINHTRTPEQTDRYKVEPYAVAADVYAHPMHVGRGGWSWYTGSAGWMYQAAVQALLGFQRAGTTVRIDPCIPRSWTEYSMEYRLGQSRYRFVVSNPDHVASGVTYALLDGVGVNPESIQLVDDGAAHEVTVGLGPAVSSAVRRRQS
jgi:cyclic beta-1,2-glucan synthetase